MDVHFRRRRERSLAIAVAAFVVAFVAVLCPVECLRAEGSADAPPCHTSSEGSAASTDPELCATIVAPYEDGRAQTTEVRRVAIVLWRDGYAELKFRMSEGGHPLPPLSLHSPPLRLLTSSLQI